jgi:hypothetical protein
MWSSNWWRRRRQATGRNLCNKDKQQTSLGQSIMCYIEVRLPALLRRLGGLPFGLLGRDGVFFTVLSLASFGTWGTGCSSEPISGWSPSHNEPRISTSISIPSRTECSCYGNQYLL